MAECMCDRYTQHGKPLETCMQGYGGEDILWVVLTPSVLKIIGCRLFHRQIARENPFAMSKVRESRPTNTIAMSETQSIRNVIGGHCRYASTVLANELAKVSGFCCLQSNHTQTESAVD